MNRSGSLRTYLRSRKLLDSTPDSLPNLAGQLRRSDSVRRFIEVDSWLSKLREQQFGRPRRADVFFMRRKLSKFGKILGLRQGLQQEERCVFFYDSKLGLSSW